ncbi:MAG: ROK family protein [Clostridia bacterium]|nr:ROK family protein [Clostridia bacterium]
MELFKYRNESENKKNVLKTIYDYNRRGDFVTRNILSEETELSFATIIRFVTELLADGIIEEFDELESTGGRKPISLRINPNYAYVISVDIGTFSVKIAVVKMNGELIQKQIFPVKDNCVPTKGLSIDELCVKLEDIIAEYGDERLLGIGVGVSGMVNCKEGRIIFCPNIRGWDNILICSLLEEKFNVPVFLDTSPRCMALAEQWFGIGQNVNNQIFASFGYGSIGSGIIIESKLFRGSGDFAGELGHVQVVSEGFLCTCGNRGCIEGYVTLPMIVMAIQDAVNENIGFSPIKLMVDSTNDINKDIIVKALDEGDKIAGNIIAETGRFMGVALADMANLFNPDLIVLGGGVIESFPQLIDEVKRTIKKRSLVTIQRNLMIEKSALGLDASIIGGAILVLQEFFS